MKKVVKYSIAFLWHFKIFAQVVMLEATLVQKYSASFILDKIFNLFDEMFF